VTITDLRPESAPGRPRTARWVPTRAGILNVWRYFDEVFEFHRGRLLLRGPNGSGKSKALEVLLPFLFDASLRAQRLSTFGTSERTMHWNLMGDGAEGRTRVGYVWLEFCLDSASGPDEPGEDTGRRWFVIGARLQASVHTTTVHPDYFTLHRRVEDGEFVTERGQPLTRAALVERIGADGAVHESAAEHRAAVRTVLFGGMNEQRYESLILALLQLRTPKLSQRLDPSLLSTLLSRALPPLGETELSELAEGFERLDRQREELERLDAEVAAAQRLAARQQTYARRVLRAAAAQLISATTEMDTRTRTARESEQKLIGARADRERAEERAAQARRQADTFDTDIEALRSRADYQEGEKAVRDLDNLRERERGARARAEASEKVATAAQAQARTDAAVAADAERAAVEVGAEADRLAEQSASAAERARLGPVYAELRAVAHSDGRRALSLVDAAVDNRHREIREVRAAVDAHAEAVNRRGFAEEALDEAREELETAIAERGSRQQEFGAALRARRDRLAEWAGTLRELRVDVEALAEAADDEPTVTALLDAAAERVRAQLMHERATATSRMDAVDLAREEVVAELAAVRAERDVAPPVPHTRTADRASARGAPFWRLVDFADGLPESARAGVEAALQSSGLLDAWVSVDGAATVEGHDVLAEPALVARAPGRSLAEVLRPEPNAAVPAERVDALLRVIAYGERLVDGHPAAVAVDGTWRLGPATGSWAKPEPEYVGATARARARERRIAQLEAERARLDGELAALAAVIDALADRLSILATERAGVPDRRALDEARSALDRAELAVGQHEKAVNQWLRKLADAADAVKERLRSLTEISARSGLPTRKDELENLAGALDVFRSVAVRWLNRCADLAAARDKADTAAAVAQRSAEHAAEREQEALRDGDELGALERAAHTLASSIDQSYHEVVERIATLRGRSVEARTAADAAAAEANAANLSIVRLETQLEAAVQNRDTAIAARDAAGDRLRELCASTLLADAGVDLPAQSGADGVRATLEAARAIAAKLPETAHGQPQIVNALARLTEELHAVRDVLGTRADLELESVGDHSVLTAVAGGIRVGAAGLLDVVKEEARRARDDLTAAEHRLFETTLTGDTRRHLADRIRQAAALVDGMNERLREVRTASDVAVQLVWQVDPALPASTQAARNLLLRNPASLSEDDRAALHRFFRERVDQARAADTSTNWEEQLAEVFDYTSWHRFVVRIDRGRGDGWQPLTKRLHGALSGGEKAIALHLPLFAAVAAHYETVPRAPRLILLDEVFVGVDTVNRGQVFALLASLDLDLVLTSDHEWGAYRELDGIAIHQLVSDDVDRAVTTARFVWDGDDWLDNPYDDDDPDHGGDG
jgi:uncharacterized protein (TIGR02680 family)